MLAVYKLIVAAVTTLLLFFGGYYIKSVDNDRDRAYQTVTQQQQVLLSHEQRITTLEESKRNTEQILNEIKASIQRVENAITTRRQ